MLLSNKLPERFFSVNKKNEKKERKIKINNKKIKRTFMKKLYENQIRN